MSGIKIGSTDKVDIKFGTEKNPAPVVNPHTTTQMDPEEVNKYLAEKYGSKLQEQGTRKPPVTPARKDRTAEEKEKLKTLYLGLMAKGIGRPEVLKRIHTATGVSPMEMSDVHLKEWGFRDRRVEKAAIEAHAGGVDVSMESTEGELKMNSQMREYLEYRSQGVGKRDTAKKMRMANATLDRLKRSWGIYKDDDEEKAIQAYIASKGGTTTYDEAADTKKATTGSEAAEGNETAAGEEAAHSGETASLEEGSPEDSEQPTTCDFCDNEVEPSKIHYDIVAKKSGHRECTSASIAKRMHDSDLPTDDDLAEAIAHDASAVVTDEMYKETYPFHHEPTPLGLEAAIEQAPQEHYITIRIPVSRPQNRHYNLITGEPWMRGEMISRRDHTAAGLYELQTAAHRIYQDYVDLNGETVALEMTERYIEQILKEKGDGRK